MAPLLLLLPLLLLGGAAVAGGPAATGSRHTSSTTAVARCTNRTDCTRELQSALSSGAARITVPALADPPGPWLVGPLVLPSSHATVTFEPGAVIEALGGEAGRRAFKPGDACLFTAEKAVGVTVIGTGATWRMRRHDYSDVARYSRAEWRHTLKLSEVDGFRLVGLRLEESGGDGIYVGARSANVHIERVELLRHYRQAMSVIGVRNLTVVDTLLASTGRGVGTAPMAGVDFEPNDATTSLTGIVFSNCTFADNFGAGVQFSLGKLGPAAPPIDVRIEYSRVDGNATAALAHDGPNTICASGPKHTGRGHGCTNATCPGSACYSSWSPGFELSANPGQRGEITVVDTSVSNTVDQGLCVRDFAPAPLRATFRRCSFSNTAQRHGPLQFPNFTSARGSVLSVTPIGIAPMGKYAWKRGGVAIGSIRFQNTTVYDDVARPWLSSVRASSIGLSGSLIVQNPHGCQLSSSFPLPNLSVSCNASSTTVPLSATSNSTRAVVGTNVVGQRYQQQQQQTQTLTVYHIGPRNVSRSSIPTDMNSGDVRGEMYWDLGWKVEAVECANRSAAPHLYASDCLRGGNNYLESQNSSNLVITQVDIETDGHFEGFASCVPDETGRHYRCDPMATSVGWWNLSAITPGAVYGNCSSPTDGCRRDNLTRVDMWRFNTWQKLGGNWYSTSSSGRCAAGQPVGHEGCTWRVLKLRKQVGKSCSDRGVFSAVTEHGKACFDACAQPLNRSSLCFTKCFYETIVGPRAGDGIGPEYVRGGMDVGELERAWLAPFLSSDPSNGCPDLRVAAAATLVN